MSKRLSSKYKISRRLGVSLWGRDRDPINRRNYAPGQHGATRRRKMSDFGLQLQEKQKLKGYYGNMTEKQFRRVFDEAGGIGYLSRHLRYDHLGDTRASIPKVVEIGAKGEGHPFETG